MVRVARSTVLSTGIEIFVHPVIATPPFFTVSVADVYELVVLKTNERQP